MNNFLRGKFIQGLLVILAPLSGLNASAQNEKSYWQSISSATRTSVPIEENKRNLTSFKLYELDVVGLKAALVNAPQRSANDAKSENILYFPDADGRLGNYRVFETSNMEPALAARYPEIKSYVGKGIDDPTAIIYFSVSPLGLQTMLIRADQPAVFIEPYTADRSAYAVYRKGDKSNALGTFECRIINTVSKTINQGVALRPNADDGNYRVFRLALSVTGEYTVHFGGTKALALAAMNNTMLRVNGVFEIDFGVHMNLIANDTVLIYTSASSDPYSPASTGANGAWNQELQTNLTNTIGNTGYDIGHLFGATGGGGNAGCIACVCVNPTGGVPLAKGSGFTSPADANPNGDNFDIDYVAHEMGHQFGGNHTFTFSNEGTIAQCEPGSGSTIMGYAGITGSTDVQAHSDAYFHGVSIQQITNYIKSTSCQTTTGTGNAIPTANAGLDYTIPKGTPFALTGIGTDANDAGLTYCWEEMDAGTSATTSPSVNATSGPAFRSFTPTSSPVHYFPRLSTIQAGATSWIWEAVPNVARSMNFRFTVRDNHAGGPANNSDDMVVTVSTASGPFVVTAPNTSVAWGTATTQTVTWNVASTTSAPVSCANVKISLSTDGGNTFPTVLLASTANDGTENITVPNTPTTTARIKVEAVGNIFFDMSNVNFTINAASPILTTITTAALASNTICQGGAVAVNYATDGPANAGNYFIVQLSNSAGSFTTPVKLDSILSVNGGTINTIIPGGTPVGSGYRIRVVSKNPVVTGSDNGTNISILAVPAAAGAIVGSTSVCKGQTGVLYSVPAITNATGYTWTLPLNASITAGANTNSITVTYSSTASSGNITVFGFNTGCNGASSSLSITAVTPIATSGTQTFTNSSGITINDATTATPYPSNIVVSGLTRLTQDVNVTITGLTHTYPDDIDILLESPTGQRVTLLSDCGLSGALSGVNLTLDDAAAVNLPDGTGIVAGSYKPTNFTSPDAYAAPGPGSFTAPVGSSSTTLATLNGFNPNGTWNLYVIDDLGSDVGTITSWSLTILVPVDTSVVTGTASVCSGTNGVAYSIPSVANATGYNWSFPSGASIATGANTNSVTVNFSGGAVSGNIAVTPFNICGNGISSKNFAVAVNNCGCGNPPTANAGSPQTVCSGGSVTLAGTIGGGASTSSWSAASGTFSNASSLSSTYTPSITNGIVTLTLTANDPDGAGPCIAAISTVQITVNQAATANAGAAQTVCAGSSVTLTGAIGGSATSSTWTAASGTFSNASSPASSYTPGIASGTITLTLTTNDPAGPCLAAISIVQITVNAAAAVNAGAAQTVCAGGTVSLTVSIGGGASSSVWSAASGTFSDVNSPTSSYTPGIASGTVTLTLTTNDPAGPCLPATSTVAITVSPLPELAGTIEGASTVCKGQTGVAYSVPAIANATGYSWTLPANASITAGANTNSITVSFASNAVSGNIVVTGTNACGDGTTSSGFAVTVNPLPDAAGTITGSSTVCQSQTDVVYSVPAIANATGYSWTLPANVSITAGANTNSITVSFASNAASGNISVTGTNACGNGTTSSDFAVSVNPSVTAGVSIAANPSGAICSGINVTFTATPANGGTTPVYQWKKNGSNVGTNSATYDNNALEDGDQITCIMISNADCVSGSPDTSDVIVMTVNSCSSTFTLHLRVFIEGLYTGSGSMVAAADPSGSPNLCDTITVELHQAFSPFDLVEASTGTINTNGNGSFVFNSITLGNSYYIVVKHRSSMETWSKIPFLFDSSEVNFDLTSP